MQALLPCRPYCHAGLTGMQALLACRPYCHAGLTSMQALLVCGPWWRIWCPTVRRACLFVYLSIISIRRNVCVRTPSQACDQSDLQTSTTIILCDLLAGKVQCQRSSCLNFMAVCASDVFLFLFFVDPCKLIAYSPLGWYTMASTEIMRRGKNLA